MKRKAAARGFMCGCGGSKAVSVLHASGKAPTATPLTTTAVSTAALSSASYHGDTNADTREPSVDGLLHELGELERGVRALGVRDGNDGAYRRPRHRRGASDWGGGGGGAGRLAEESVAVVKESADPLGDFRRSMLQMIVENGIVGGAELRELLHRFLSLNSARHHHLIFRAFAEIWEEVFAGSDDQTPALLPHKPQNRITY